MALCAEEVKSVKFKIASFRHEVESYHNIWYKSVVKLADELNVTPSTPRTTAKQVHRSNTPASDDSEYYRRVITIPLLGKSRKVKMSIIILQIMISG